MNIENDTSELRGQKTEDRHSGGQNSEVKRENPRPMEIRSITAAETIPLRAAVLRTGRPIETARFAGDDDASTRHFGAFVDGNLVGIASLFATPMNNQPGVPSLQLRGMAVAPGSRGTGIGKALAMLCIGFAYGAGVKLLWCNARVSAAGLYQKLGFEIVGNEFDIPDVGPHFKMTLQVR